MPANRGKKKLPESWWIAHAKAWAAEIRRIEPKWPCPRIQSEKAAREIYVKWMKVKARPDREELSARMNRVRAQRRGAGIGGAYTYTPAESLDRAISRWITHPPKVGLAVCELCETDVWFPMYASSTVPRYHHDCAAIARRAGGQRPSATLPARQRPRGRPKLSQVAPERRARFLVWAFRNYLRDESQRQIAKSDGVTHPTVRDGIDDLIKRLPDPALLAKQYRPYVVRLADAAGAKLVAPPASPIQHGTEGGYNAHIRRRELPTCGPCRDAHAAYRRALQERSA